MARHGTARHNGGVQSAKSKGLFQPMAKLSTVHPIDLSISDSDSYEPEVLNNVEQVIHILQCCSAALAQSQDPRFVFRRKSDTAFECWVEANDGVVLKPTPLIAAAPNELDPYRTASYSIIRRLRNWNKDFPTGEFLEIPIQF
jgi:hypothetical protein